MERPLLPPTAPETPRSPKKHVPRWLWIVGGILAVVLVLTIIFLVVGVVCKKDSTNTVCKAATAVGNVLKFVGKNVAAIFWTIVALVGASFLSLGTLTKKLWERISKGKSDDPVVDTTETTDTTDDTTDTTDDTTETTDDTTDDTTEITDVVDVPENIIKNKDGRRVYFAGYNTNRPLPPLWNPL